MGSGLLDWRIALLQECWNVVIILAMAMDDVYFQISIIYGKFLAIVAIEVDMLTLSVYCPQEGKYAETVSLIILLDLLP